MRAPNIIREVPMWERRRFIRQISRGVGREIRRILDDDPAAGLATIPLETSLLTFTASPEERRDGAVTLDRPEPKDWR